MKRSLIGLIIVSLLLAACGARVEVTYACAGTAEEVTVTYEDTQEVVSLPWEFTTEKRGNFEVTLRAENNNDPIGEVTCDIRLDGERVATAGGRGGADIEVIYDKRDGVSAFSLGLDGEPIPTEGDPIDFTVTNDYVTAICEVYIKKVDDREWGPNRLEQPLETTLSVNIPDIETIEYDVLAYACEGEMLGQQRIYTVEQAEVTYAEVADWPIFTLYNDTSYDLCYISFPLQRFGAVNINPIAPTESFVVRHPAGSLGVAVNTCSDGGSATLSAEISNIGYEWTLTDEDLQ